MRKPKEPTFCTGIVVPPPAGHDLQADYRDQYGKGYVGDADISAPEVIPTGATRSCGYGYGMPTFALREWAAQ